MRKTKREQLSYGAGLGDIEAQIGSGTWRVIKVTDNTFFSGIWAGMESAELEVRETKNWKRLNARRLFLRLVDHHGRRLCLTGAAGDLGKVRKGTALFFWGSIQ